MKKSLSLLIALAMVFGMFASMASAATTELTTAQKYQWFVDQGVLKGDPSGNPRLDSTLTRAEFATIVASVGGLKLVNSASSFADVKVKDWYFTAIQSASDAGLVNGIGAGKFGPKLNVTVEQVAKVAVILAGIKPVDGAVVAGSSAWAGPYIQAAINAGLTVPTNYKANATRAQTIDLAYAVYQLKALPVLSDVVTTVNSDDTITVTGKVVGKADSVKVALGTAAEVAATLKDDKTFTFTTAKQVPGTYKLTVVAYDGTKGSVAVTKEVVIDGFTVESVTVLNGKQIAVKFNKAVAEGSLTGGFKNSAYYTLDTATHPVQADIALSSDKQTVTLTFDPAFTLDRYAQFAVSSDLKSASGQSLKAYKQAVLLADTVAPTVKNVSYIGKSAKIEFSEPLRNLGTLSINGIQIGDAPTSATNIVYTLTKDTQQDVTAVTISPLNLGTSYAFYLISGKDVAGKVFDYNTTLTPPTDTTSPTVTAVTVSGANVKVKFSEAIDTSVVSSIYAEGVTGLSPIAATSYDSATYTVTYNASSWLTAKSANFLNLSVRVSGYKDLAGLNGADYTQAVTISKDTTAPVVQSVFYEGNSIYVKFDEPITQVIGNAAAIAYNLTDANSIYSTGSLTVNASVGYDLDRDTNPQTNDTEKSYLKLEVTGNTGTSYAVLNSAGKLVAGKYNITLPETKVYDDSSNKIANTNVSVEVTASTGTSGSVKVDSWTETAPGTLKIVFNAELTTAALDVSKFLINDVALPTGSTLKFLNDAKTVIITLPAGTIPVNGYRTLKVVNIVDKSGNTLSDTGISTSIPLKENVKPVAQSVTLTSDKVLTVAASEVLDPGAVTTGVTVSINGVDVSKADIESIQAVNNTVVITTKSSKFTASQTIAVKIASTDAKDLNGNTIADITLNK